MSIKNFEELILPHLDKSCTILNYNLEKLLSAGENYGSVMYKVEVKIRNSKGEEEAVYLVAKTTLPKCWIWELFTTVVTFKKEADFYKLILPTINKFLEERDLPGFLNTSAKYYGSRISLDSTSNVVDEDAVLVLENLKIKGYEVSDRFIGFNLEVSKAIIDAMVKNHAVLIAFKQTHPEEFFHTILPPILAKFNSFLTDDRIRELVKSYIIVLKQTGCNLEEYEKKISDAFKMMIAKWDSPPEDNDFDTLCHNDLWTNNILLKLQHNQPIKVKLVDYQVTMYLPGANDLIFFLYSSVELSVLRENVDYLIGYYYDSFINTLTKLKVDISKFTRHEFDETVETASRNQLSHLLMLLPPIFTVKGKAKELLDFKPEDFKPAIEDLHKNYLPRLHFLLTDYINRKWL